MELKPSIKERSLRAFMDLAILRVLLHRPMTAYELKNLFIIKHSIIFGPPTIYSKLSSMQREELVKCTRFRTRRTYSITEEGRKIADNMPAIAEEICNSVKTLLIN